MNVLQQLGTWLHPSAKSGDAVAPNNYAHHLLASLMTMAWFVEARDPYTGGHLWRVSQYARLLADAAGLPGASVARIGLGGFLHDLGKVGVPDAILRKTDRLTDEEYAVIKTHPSMGARMLAGHPLAALVHDAIFQHHERPDGKGYPQGLGAEAISDMAAIVGICDAFDAMTSSRPYRKGMPLEKALSIIEVEQGQQFHGDYARYFVALGMAGHLRHIAGHSDEGIPLQSCPMCGPTLTLRREHQPGELVYCHNCAGEFKLVRDDADLVAEPTGRSGTPSDLEPQLDAALIARTVKSAVQALPVTELMQGF